MRCLPKMWMQETFAYQGEFWSMPERTILPKPYQKPHPPMWVAVTSPGTEIDAADRGLGSLGLSFAGFDEQEKKIKEYRRRIQHLRAGRRVRQRAGRHHQLPVLPRGREDRRRDGQEARQHLQLSRDAADLDARGVLLAVLPVARPAAGAAPCRDRARRLRAADRGHGLWRSGAHHPRDQEVGIARRRLRQLHPQRQRGGAAGPGDGEPAPVRQGSDAGLRQEAGRT